jgi:hypothetical protein
VILHHEDDNVPDLREQVRAGRPGRVRERSVRLTAPVPEPEFQLSLLEVFPHNDLS